MDKVRDISRTKINKKEAGIGPFFKKVSKQQWICYQRLRNFVTIRYNRMIFDRRG